MSKRLDHCKPATLRANRTEAMKFARVYGETSAAGKHFLAIARACDAELVRRGLPSAINEPNH